MVRANNTPDQRANLAAVVTKYTGDHLLKAPETLPRRVGFSFVVEELGKLVTEDKHHFFKPAWERLCERNPDFAEPRRLRSGLSSAEGKRA